MTSGNWWNVPSAATAGVLSRPPAYLYRDCGQKKETYYTRMNPIFLQFCKDAKGPQHSISVSDCNLSRSAISQRRNWK